MAIRRQTPEENSPDFGFLDDSQQAETASHELTGVHRRPADDNRGNDPPEVNNWRSIHPKDQSQEPQATRYAGIGESRLSGAIVGYAIGLTCLLMFLLVTGRVSMFGGHPLESLPDLRPLQPNEFQMVPDGAALPENHVLNLGQSRRFGDVVITPQKVTREPLQFQGFLSGEFDERMTTNPVLKLWIQFENVADEYAFVPFDVSLMSHRSPPAGQDEDVLANSFLTRSRIAGADQGSDKKTSRILNYLHSADSNFVIVGQNAGQLIQPEESVTMFLASGEVPESRNTVASEDYLWRVQFRKGVNIRSGHGVTTLIDVRFSNSEIADVSSEPSTEPATGAAKAITPG